MAKSWPVLGNYIAGSFSPPTELEDSILSISPADATDCLGEFPVSIADVDAAVDSSCKAFSSWKRLTAQERSAYLRKFQEVVRDRMDELAEALAREVGKPLWEAKTEIAAMIGKVDITLAEGAADLAELKIAEIQPNTDGLCRHRPLGVLAVVGPFNFPLHLPNGHIVPALAAGNTVIFKPSEKSPLTGQLLTECIAAAGFPAGVFSLVQGSRAVSKRLVEHRSVAGVLFTGSYDVGLAIKRATLDQPGKLLALEMGGKNSAIVCGDADIDLALYETVTGAFLTTGQRCSATSKIFVHDTLMERFLQRFRRIAGSLVIDHPLENPFMGPVIDSASAERIFSHGEQLRSDGFHVLQMPTPLERKHKGNYIQACVAHADSLWKPEKLAQTRTQAEEVFGPAVTIFPFSELDAAIDAANANEFGLVSSVFTKSRENFEQCWHDLQTGLVNWNKSTVGASSKLPFGGLKKSGNHFPTALYAGRYVTAPISSMCFAGKAPLPVSMPGLVWDE